MIRPYKPLVMSILEVHCLFSTLLKFWQIIFKDSVLEKYNLYTTVAGNMAQVLFIYIF